MNISKFFSMLIAGLAIIGFTSVGMASDASKHNEGKETTKYEVIAEGGNAAKEESKVESKEGIQYGAKHEFGSDEKEAKVEEKG